MQHLSLTVCVTVSGSHTIKLNNQCRYIYFRCTNSKEGPGSKEFRNMSALSEETDDFQWIEMSFASLSLIGVSTIAIKSTMAMKTDKHMNRLLVVLFYAGVCSAILHLIAVILNNTAWLISSDTMRRYTSIISWLLFLAFLYCLLTTLVVRLWVVFKDSAWRMSGRIRKTFIVLGTLALVGDFGMMVILITDDENLQTTLLLLAGATLLLYAMTSALAVYLFVRNLLRLAALQSSRSPLSRNNVLGPPSLNRQQMKMVEQSTKYLSLFLIAMMSTVISLVPLFAGAELITWILSRLDVCVNVLCLHLQFRFAKSHYDKCCSKADGCTLKAIESCVRRKVNSH